MKYFRFVAFEKPSLPSMQDRSTDSMEQLHSLQRRSSEGAGIVRPSTTSLKTSGQQNHVIRVSSWLLALSALSCALPISIVDDGKNSSLDTAAVPVRFADGNYRYEDCIDPTNPEECPSTKYITGDRNLCNPLPDGRYRGQCFACLDHLGAWRQPDGQDGACVCPIGKTWEDGEGGGRYDWNMDTADFANLAGCVYSANQLGNSCIDPDAADECPREDYLKGDESQCQRYNDDETKRKGRCRACLRDGGAWNIFSADTCVCPLGSIFLPGDPSIISSIISSVPRSENDWYRAARCERAPGSVASAGATRERDRNDEARSELIEMCVQSYAVVGDNYEKRGNCMHSAACIDAFPEFSREDLLEYTTCCFDCLEAHGKWAVLPYQGQAYVPSYCSGATIDCAYDDAYLNDDGPNPTITPEVPVTDTCSAACKGCKESGGTWNGNNCTCTGSTSWHPGGNQCRATCTGDCTSCEASGGTWMGGAGGASCLCKLDSVWDNGTKQCEPIDSEAGVDCFDGSGKCIDINSQSCWAGQGTIVRNQCPGGDNVRCCRTPDDYVQGGYTVPEHVGDTCSAEGKTGECRDSTRAASCSGGHYVSDKCLGPEQVKCCVPEVGTTLPDARPACSNANVLSAMLPGGGVSSWACKTSSACSTAQGTVDNGFTCGETGQVCCQTVVKTLCPTSAKYSCITSAACISSQNEEEDVHGVVKSGYTCSTGVCCYKAWITTSVDAPPVVDNKAICQNKLATANHNLSSQCEPYSSSSCKEALGSSSATSIQTTCRACYGPDKGMTLWKWNYSGSSIAGNSCTRRATDGPVPVY